VACQCIPAVLWTRRVLIEDMRNRTGHGTRLTMLGPNRFDSLLSSQGVGFLCLD
jgi:hypothetical protein